MLPITYNTELEKWEVKDQNGKVLWRGNTYGDAAQFADDYLKQAAMRNVIAGSTRG